MTTWLNLTEAIRQDVHFALRGIRRRPAFTAVIATTLAFGIGANTMMFGILDRLLLQAPPHIADPDRVVMFNNHQRGSDGFQTTQAYGVYKALRADVTDFADVAVATPANLSRRAYFPFGQGMTASRVGGSLVSGNYFSLLGVRPALGRFFTAEEERDENPQNLAVIGHGFWKRQFAGRSDVIGEVLDVGAKKYTVVGVAPAGFTGTELGDIDVWLPVTAAEDLRFARGPDWATSANSSWIYVIARFKPGASLERAAAQAGASYRSWTAQHLTNPSAKALAVNDSQVAVLGSIIPGRSLSGFGIGASSSEVKVSKLLAAVAIAVLLIACANVANLLLVRALARRRETAVRLALGVGRRRLVGQLLVEGLVLAGLGAIGALVVADIGSHAIRVWLLGDGAWTGTSINSRALAFTAGVAVLTGVVTSLAPALEASRADLNSALKTGGREGSVNRSRLRSSLLVAQAALAIVLLSGAGLFIRSLNKVAELDIGIDAEHVLVAQMNQSKMSNGESLRLFEDFALRAKQIPGVTASAVTVGLPFGLSWGTQLFLTGRETPKLKNNPFQYAITPEYFDALGVRLLSGRRFTEGDRLGTSLVAVVNEELARRYWPGQSPIGVCVKVGADTMPCTTVVGVVSNTRRQSLIEEPVAQIYRPLDQLPESETKRTVGFFGYTLVVRAQRDAAALAEPLRRAMQSAGPSLPYANVRRMRQMFESQTRPWELGARVFTAFGALALALAAVGLFSVVAFTIGQRTHELGVRAALGAQSSDLLRLTMARGLWPALVGIAVGIGLALAGGRFVGALLFEVSPRDPIVLGGASAALFAAAIVASLIPAARVRRVDPTIALRTE